MVEGVEMVELERSENCVSKDYSGECSENCVSKDYSDLEI